MTGASAGDQTVWQSKLANSEMQFMAQAKSQEVEYYRYIFSVFWQKYAFNPPS
jgi:hypothetical protein